MRIAREEIFGPVIAIIEFESYDDAIAKANDTADRKIPLTHRLQTYCRGQST
jgi:acyl-CoA reductase-like NAD-dependent aldehyde dehydrogenase